MHTIGVVKCIVLNLLCGFCTVSRPWMRVLLAILLAFVDVPCTVSSTSREAFAGLTFPFQHSRASALSHLHGALEACAASPRLMLAALSVADTSKRPRSSTPNPIPSDG
jgi:hypothetical protein